ncbi:xylulokinase [Salinisphaera hydrothermalis]|uniref:xylulokinase n=1 Tax=Salinisphaera hydrothermalis TaxID=563188 RepID=UPI0033424E1A
MTPLVLGIDVGTSACKSVLMTPDGELVDTVEASYPLSTPRPGWAEQAPALWWDAVQRSVADMLARTEAGDRVVGIGLSGQMHGLVALDEADTVLRPALLWCDQRGAEESAVLIESLGGTDRLLDYTNNPMLPGFTGSKLLWLARHEPDVLARTRRFLNPKDFIRLKLTGEYATDVSDASGTGFFDVRKRCWSDDLIARAGLAREIFPTAFESSEPTGGLRADVAQHWGMTPGVPVSAGGGDSVIQTTSMGVVAPGMTGITLGTAGIVGGSSNECPDNPGGRLQVSCGNAADRWHVMGVTLNAGGAFQWLIDALRPLAGDGLDYDRLIELAASAPVGSEHLIFAPHLMGERCPEVAPGARGAWVGLTRAHDISHMTRSVIEGAIMNMRAILDLFEEAGLGTERLRVSGGATNSPFWLQTLADVTGHPLATVSGAATGGAAGAALVAGLGAGFWADIDEATAHVAELESLLPHAERARRYNEIYPAHKSLLAQLAPCYQQLAAIEDRTA